MSRGQAAFTVPEILHRWDENFGIPYDGEGSDISSENSGPDIDTDQAVLGCETALIDQESEVLDNLHEVELADEEEIGSTEGKNETLTGRKPAFYDVEGSDVSGTGQKLQEGVGGKLENSKSREHNF